MRRFIILSILGLLFLSSCQKQPTADFTVDKTTAFIYEPIHFKNATVDGYRYEWFFGDGDTSSEENPTHAYKVGGTYTVSLIAYSKNGKKKDTKTTTINIKNYITLTNSTWTVLDVDINDDYWGEIQPNQTVRIENVPNKVYVYAESDNYLGDMLYWDFNIDIKKKNSANFVVGPEHYCLLLQNNFTPSEDVYLTDITVNKGTTDETIEHNINIEPQSSEYGYYKNLNGYSNVYVEADNGHIYYLDPINLSTTENNQIVVMTIGNDKIEKNITSKPTEGNIVYPLGSKKRR